MPKWHFLDAHPRATERNPVSGAFFADEAFDNDADGLVRESIQNSLDARIDSNGVARVRIYLSGGPGLAPEKAAFWFDSLYPHLESRDSGIRDDARPKRDEACQYLVIEDFDTTGLLGDVTDTPETGSKDNDFYAFFRGERVTYKAEGKRGSWGIGKTVFPAASRANTFFGMTIRSNDPRPLLMGHSILRFHSDAGGKRYCPDAYFGDLPAKDRAVLPIESVDLIERFRQDFNIKRRNESGLSVVIPWRITELDSKSIIAAVLKRYFLAIVRGRLVVEVGEGSRTPVELNAANIDTYVDLHAKETDFPKIRPLLRLAEWSESQGSDSRIEIPAPPADMAQNWTKVKLPDAVADAIRTKLDSRERIAIRVNLHVRPKDASETVPCFFDVAIDHTNDGASHKPEFVREDLVVPHAGAAVSELLCLAVIDAGPLANLLRAAEPPTHIRWDQKTEGFKSAYYFGKSVIDYVATSVRELIRMVRLDEREADDTLLLDLFSLPTQEKDTPKGKQKKRKSGGDSEEGELNIPKAKPKRFKVRQLAGEGGFTIVKGDPDAPLPTGIEVEVAYDVRRGNPLAKYRREDFQLGMGEIKCEFEGCEADDHEENWVRLRILSPDFKFKVTGFDTRRDLHVAAKAVDLEGVLDGATA